MTDKFVRHPCFSCARTQIECDGRRPCSNCTSLGLLECVGAEAYEDPFLSSNYDSVLGMDSTSSTVELGVPGEGNPGSALKESSLFDGDFQKNLQPGNQFGRQRNSKPMRTAKNDSLAQMVLHSPPSTLASKRRAVDMNAFSSSPDRSNDAAAVYYSNYSKHGDKGSLTTYLMNELRRAKADQHRMHEEMLALQMENLKLTSYLRDRLPPAKDQGLRDSYALINSSALQKAQPVRSGGVTQPLVVFDVTQEEPTALAANFEFCKLLGYDQSEVVGKTWTQFVPFEYIPRTRRYLSAQPPITKFDQVYRHKNGSLFVVEDNHTFLRKGGRVIADSVTLLPCSIENILKRNTRGQRMIAPHEPAEGSTMLHQYDLDKTKEKTPLQQPMSDVSSSQFGNPKTATDEKLPSSLLESEALPPVDSPLHTSSYPCSPMSLGDEGLGSTSGGMDDGLPSSYDKPLSTSEDAFVQSLLNTSGEKDLFALGSSGDPLQFNLDGVAP